jgi:hypothetical protein
MVTVKHYLWPCQYKKWPYYNKEYEGNESLGTNFATREWSDIATDSWYNPERQRGLAHGGHASMSGSFPQRSRSQGRPEGAALAGLPLDGGGSEGNLKHVCVHFYETACAAATNQLVLKKTP